jgi:sugar phosphate isomerase/epimerase
MTDKISRRGLFQQTAAAGAAIGIGVPLRAIERDSSRKPEWKVAIGLNGFESGEKKYKKKYPIREVLGFAAKAGFDGVELVQNWPEGPYPASDDKERIGALRDLYKEFGLHIFSLQIGGADAFSPSDDARRQWIQQTRGRIALARALGCDCVGIWPFGKLRGQTLDQAIRNLAASLREVSKIAGDHGIIAAFEIEPPFVFNSEDTLKRVLEEAADPQVKTIYDPYRAGRKGIQAIRDYCEAA